MIVFLKVLFVTLTWQIKITIIKYCVFAPSFNYSNLRKTLELRHSIQIGKYDVS